MRNKLCSLLMRQGVDPDAAWSAKTNLAAADLFLEMARVSVLGETEVARALCEIVLYLEGTSPEVSDVIVRAVRHLTELVGATTLDSESVTHIDQALQNNVSVDEVRKKFSSRSTIPA